MQLTGSNPDFKEEDEYMTLCIYTEASLLHIEWHQHVNSRELRAGFLAALNQAINNKTKYWLSDTRNLNYAEAADQKWLIQTGGQLLAKSNVQKVAHVVSDDSIRMLVAYNIADKIKDLFPQVPAQFEIFTDPVKALHWLKKD